jgi:hypothetical protein
VIARQVPGQLPLWEPSRPISPTLPPKRPQARRTGLPTRILRHFLSAQEAPARPATRSPDRSYFHGRRLATINPSEEYL